MKMTVPDKEFAELVADQTYIRQMVKEVHKILTGNGQPGLVKDVNKLEAHFEDHIRESERERGSARYWLHWVVSFVAIIIALFTLIKGFII